MSMPHHSGIPVDGVSVDSLASIYFERQRSTGVERYKPLQGEGTEAGGSNDDHPQHILSESPFTPSTGSHLAPSSRRHSGSPLRLTFPGWQQPPNTPSPPPPYASRWQRSWSGSEGGVSPQTLPTARPRSCVFFVGREGASGGGEDGFPSMERSTMFISGAGDIRTGDTSGLGLGMILDWGDEESSVSEETGDTLGAVWYEQVEVKMRKKLEEMRGEIERQVLDESRRRIAQLEDALSSAQAEIATLRKEKAIMEDEMREVEERVVAEIKLYAPDRPRELELRPLGLCSRARPSPTPRGMGCSHEERDPSPRPTRGGKKRWSATSLADIPQRPRTAGLPGVPYRSSATPLPTLHSNAVSSHPTASPSLTHSATRNSRPPSLSPSLSPSSLSPSSSPSPSPLSTPTHSPERTKSFRLSQRFTSLSHNSVNAQAYEELVARVPMSEDPGRGKSGDEQGLAPPSSTGQGQRRKRPQSLHGWAPPRGFENVAPEAGSSAVAGTGDCPVAAAYRKLVGEDCPVRLESLAEMEIEPEPEVLRGLHEVYSPSREQGLPRQRMERDDEREDRKESVKVRRQSVRVSWARIPGQPSTEITELPAGEASLLSGFRAVRVHVTPLSYESTFPEDIFPAPLSVVSPAAAEPEWAAESHRDLRMSHRHQPERLQLQHVPRTRQITAVLGTLAQYSGWVTVFGFAGLTVGGWCMRIKR